MSLRLVDRGYGVTKPTVYKINGMWARVCPWCRTEVPFDTWEDALVAAGSAWTGHGLKWQRDRDSKDTVAVVTSRGSD